MRKLPPPERTTDIRDLTDNVVTYTYRNEARGYSPTPAEITSIVGLYDQYDMMRGQIAIGFDGSTLQAALVNTIKLAFEKTYEGRGLFKLRNELLTDAGLCPICGIDPATQLDHFLPKSDYGVFAIYIRNLIPLCKTCNEKKRSYAGLVPAEQYVHAYFEDIPDAQFISASVEMVGDALVTDFGVLVGAPITDDLAARLTNQFSTLKLSDRYTPEINVYVGGQTVSMHDLYDAGGADLVASYLMRLSKQEAGRYHLNDWRSLLFSSLSQHEEFCDGGFARAFPLHESLR